VDGTGTDDGGVLLRLSCDEVMVLHEALSRTEWADDLEAVMLEPGAERQVATDLMLALRPGVPHLGTQAYGAALSVAEARVVDRDRRP